MTSQPEENHLQSVQHPLVKEITALAQKKARQESGLLLVETRHPIQEALKAGLLPKHYLYLASAPDSSLVAWPDAESMYTVSEPVMKKISTTDSIPPCAAVFQLPDWSETAFFAKTSGVKNPLYILADKMQDPGNLGTLIRSAIAFGATGILLVGQSVDAASPKVIRASAGLVFGIPILQTNESAETLLSNPQFSACQSLFTTGHETWQGKATLSYREADYRKPTILVLGTEGQGLSEEMAVGETAQAVTIPLAPEAESLNVSVSASVILAEAAFQRAAVTV